MRSYLDRINEEKKSLTTFDMLYENMIYKDKRTADLSSDILRILFEHLKQNKVSIIAFAQRVGVKTKKVEKWLSGNHDFKLSEIAQIESAMCRGNNLIKIYGKDYKSKEHTSPFPYDAHSVEVFKISETKDGNMEAFIGFKNSNNDFNYVQVPFDDTIKL